MAALEFELSLAVNHAVDCAMELGPVLKLQLFLFKFHNGTHSTIHLVF